MSDLEKCLASAQRSLSMREYSKLQIETKLKNKGFDINTIENVLSKLQEEGFQSDDRYTKEYIIYRQNNGYSSKKITYELKLNGIDTEIINKNFYNFKDDFDVLYNLAKRKILDYKFDDQKKMLKYVNFFKSRGFDNNTILKVINILKNHEK